MSYESAAIATQEMKGLSRFRRPVGAIAVLALAAGLSGCGAQEQARPTESGTSSTVAAEEGFRPTHYASWADEVEGPVWIAPGYVSKKLDANSGDTYALPLATVKGDPSCSQPGAVRKNPAADVKLYTATHDPEQINEVPQSDINFITTSDGNGVNAVKESGLVVTQCNVLSSIRQKITLVQVKSQKRLLSHNLMAHGTRWKLPRSIQMVSMEH